MNKSENNIIIKSIESIDRINSKMYKHKSKYLYINYEQIPVHIDNIRIN